MHAAAHEGDGDKRVTSYTADVEASLSQAHNLGYFLAHSCEARCGWGGAGPHARVQVNRLALMLGHPPEHVVESGTTAMAHHYAGLLPPHALAGTSRLVGLQLSGE